VACVREGRQQGDPRRPARLGTTARVERAGHALRPVD
jgi:hypothetical protein